MPSSAVARSRRARIIALVIAGAVLIWLAVQAVGAALALPAAFAFAADLAALVALGWALWSTYVLWRQRDDETGVEN